MKENKMSLQGGEDGPYSFVQLMIELHPLYFAEQKKVSHN